MKIGKKRELYIPLTEGEEEAGNKRKILRYLLPGIFALLVIASLFFVQGSLIPESDDTQYRTSEEIILPMNSVSSLNPLASTDKDTYYISKLIYDSLFEMDGDMNAVPDLVADYSYDKTETAVTLTLRKSVKWHDGKTLDADDVAFTIDALQLAKDASLYQSMVDAIAETEVLSDRKIRIVFKDETNVGGALLTFPILPKHQFDSIHDAVAQVSDFHPIGTGTYEFESFDHSNGLLLSANESYFGEQATNTIKFNVLPKSADLFNLIKVSNVSLVFSSRVDRDTEISGNDITKVNFPSNRLEYLGYNMNGDDSGRKSVRQAIAYGIDVPKLINEIYFGNGVLSQGLFYPGYLGVAAVGDLDAQDADTLAGSDYALDVSKAKSVLSDAGFADEDGSGYFDASNGEDINLIILVNSNDKYRVRAAEAIQDMLKTIDLRSQVVSLPWDEYQAALATGEFDLYLGGIKVTPSMDFRPWLATEGEYNFTRYQNQNVENLLNDFGGAFKTEEKQAAYLKLQEALLDQLPCYGLFYRTTGAFVSPAFKGEPEPLFTDYYRGSQPWALEYEVTAEEEAE